MLQILGPQLVRLEKEFLSPFLERVFGIRMRSGMLPPAPPEVVQYAQAVGGNMQVEFIGPVARAKRQAEAGVIDGLISFTGATAQIEPSVVDNVDFDEALRERARIDQVPKKLLRTPTQVEEIRQQRMEREAAAAQQQAMQAGAETMNQLTQPMQAAMEAQNGGQ